MYGTLLLMGRNMGKTIAVIAQKGGVGKTAISTNVAYCLSQLNKRVLVIDIDPSHNGSDVFIEDESFTYSIVELLKDKNFDPNKAIYQAKVQDRVIDNLFIIPSLLNLGIVQYDIFAKAHKERLLARQIEKFKDGYDFIIIDCPPMTSEFSTIALYAAELVLIPLEYARDSIKGVQHLFNSMKEVKEDQVYDYKIVRNKRDERNSLVRKIENEIEPFVKNGIVLSTVIRKDESINLAKNEDQPVIVYAPKSKGTEDYMTLAKELIND
jgi:chromosome partitioning protein